MEQFLNVYNAPADTRFTRRASVNPSAHGSTLKIVFMPQGFWFHEPVYVQVSYKPEYALLSKPSPRDIKVGDQYVEVIASWGSPSGVDSKADFHESSLAFVAALTSALDLKEQILAMVKNGKSFEDIAIPAMALDMPTSTLDRDYFGDYALLISSDRVVFQHIVFQNMAEFLAHCESQGIQDIPTREADDHELQFWNYIAYTLRSETA